MRTWRWRVYLGNQLLGDVLAATFDAACRAPHGFGNRPFTVVCAGQNEARGYRLSRVPGSAVARVG